MTTDEFHLSESLNPVLSSSFMTYHQIFNMCNTTGDTNEAEIIYPSAAINPSLL